MKPKPQSALQKSSSILIPCPHPGQFLLWRGRNRFNVVRCGRRWGKTAFAIFLIASGVFGQLTGTPVPVSYMAPSYKMMVTVWDSVTVMLAPAIRKTDTQNRRIWLANGQWIDFWSLQDPSRVRGQKYGLMIVDEAALVDGLDGIWQQVLRPTLTDLSGHAWFLSTPIEGTGFEVLDGFSARFGNWRSFQAPTHGNPFLSRAELAEIESQMPDDFFRQEYLAEYVSFAGKNFFQYFSPAKHTGVAGTPPNTLFLSWDFNISNTCLVIDGKPGHVAVLREYLGEILDLEGICRQVRMDYPGIRFTINGDASGNAGSAVSSGNVSAYEIIRSALNIRWEDFNVPASNPSHLNSYLQCNTFLRRHSLKINPQCENLLNDMRKVKVIREGRKLTIDKSKADLTHYSDPLRYHLFAEHQYLFDRLHLSDAEVLQEAELDHSI